MAQPRPATALPGATAAPNLIEGTDGANYLHGTAAIDLVLGYGGDDTIFYTAAQMQGDTIGGGAGFDELSIDFSGATRAMSFTAADTAIPVTLQGALVAGVESFWVTGTGFADSFTGGRFDDRFDAGNGNDTARGGLGDDALLGEAGNDLLDGGNGQDGLVGGDGNDTLRGGNGRDHLNGGAGHDRLYGDAGDDIGYGDAGADSMEGGDGQDTLFGGDDNDTLRGGNGDDRLAGNAGADSLDGGAGNDAIERRWNEGADNIDGGAGIDRLAIRGVSGSFTAKASNVLNVLADGTRIINVEAYDIDGETGHDSLTGEAGDDVLNGFSGNDRLRGAGGNDLLMGGDGRDTLDGGAGDDALIVGAGGADSISAGTGTDTVTIDRFSFSGTIAYTFAQTGTTATLSDGTVVTGAEIFDIRTAYGNDNLSAAGALRVSFDAAGGDNTLAGSAGDDYLSAGYGNDVITGGAGRDRIVDGGGTNRIDAGIGDDEVSVDGSTGRSVITLGEGNDIVYLNNGGGSAGGIYEVDGGAGIDHAWVNRSASTANLTFTLSANATLLNGNLVLKDIERIRMSGGSGHDNFTAGALDDWLNGGTGNDTLRGQGGNDNLEGWYGADRLEGGDGHDTLYATGGIKDGYADTLLGGAGDDLLYMNRADRGDGGTGTDRVILDLSEETAAFRFYLSGPTAVTQVDNSTSFTGVESIWVDAGWGADTITGGAAADVLEGNAGSDRLRGGGGNDELRDGDGADTLAGDAGDDLLVRTDFDANGLDLFDGGAGIDTLRFNIVGGAPVLLDLLDQQWNDGLAAGLTVQGIENVVGSEADDDIRGDGLANGLWGGKGTDWLEGRGGDDLLAGGEGSDLLAGGAGHDRFQFGAGATGSGDFILDFVRGEDLLAIERAGFGLAADYALSLVVGAAPQANAAKPQFLFETGTGRLWFDADGSGSEWDATWVATLDGVTTLTAADFVLL